MNNIIMLPILLPLITAGILILLSKKHTAQRFVSAISTVLLLSVSCYVLYVTSRNGVVTLEAGGWNAPYGIVLVSDRLAAIMVMLTALIGLVCLFYSFSTIHPKRERFYFYPFYFFLLTGVNGAFLTGDIFNLFVFFEVMLLSSYALMAIGGTKYQLRETFKYAVINVFSSILFLVAIAYLYGITGTVNMAHLAERVGELQQTGALQFVAVLFFIVFATKGALFPLYFWLPRSYFGPPAAITALFGGLLTKVGIYALIRVFSLIFTYDRSFTHGTIMLVLAGFTMLLGVLGAVAQFDFKKILAYHIISQLGYMVMGLGLFTPMALAGTIYFLAHNIIVKTGLLLYAGAAQKVTGTTDLKRMGGLLKTHPVLGWSFLILGLSIAGIPPLSGFFGKFPLIIAGFNTGNYFLTFLALGVGLLTLFSMLKIFLYVFWRQPKHTEDQAQISLRMVMLPTFLLVGATIVLGIAAEPFYAFAEDVAEELLNPSIYIQAVLKE